MKTSWEKNTGKRTDYVDVHYNEVVVGYHYGSGMTDNAGTCTHDEFLKGRFQGLIEERFGKDVLEQVILAVRGSPDNVDHIKKRDEIKRLRDYLEHIPLNQSLLSESEDSVIINGFKAYGNQGGYKTEIVSENHVLRYESVQGTLINSNTGEEIKLHFDFHASSCVEKDDYFYIIGGQNFHVLSPEGDIVFSTDSITWQGNGKVFGSYLRINNVFRNGDNVFASYWWFYSDFPKGILFYELNEGFKERAEFDD